MKLPNAMWRWLIKASIYFFMIRFDFDFEYRMRNFKWILFDTIFSFWFFSIFLQSHSDRNRWTFDYPHPSLSFHSTVLLWVDFIQFFFSLEGRNQTRPRLSIQMEGQRFIVILFFSSLYRIELIFNLYFALSLYVCAIYI